MADATDLEVAIARRFARNRVLANMERERLEHDEDRVLRATDYAWRDFLSDARAALAAIEASGHVILLADLPYETRECAAIHTLRLTLGKADADPWDTVDAVWQVISSPRDIAPTEPRG